MKYAHILKGQVIGIREAEVLPEVDAETHLVVLTEGVEVALGWTYVTDTVFQPPVIVAPPPEYVLEHLKRQARAELQSTDLVFRRIYEANLAGEEVEQTSIIAWRTYCQQLRAVLKESNPDAVQYPTRPPYPANT